MDRVSDIREQLKTKLENEDFVLDKSGVKTIEIVGSSFIADEVAIFGKVNWDYVEKEIDWYTSQSRNVYRMENPPKVWTEVCDKDGIINSNYGWCIFSEENYDQFTNAAYAINNNRDTRRAIMIYTRPSMQYDYNKNGMSDFMCTNTVQYLVRDNKIHAIVNMRSNDAIFGYKNDRAWQDHVLMMMANITSYEPGDIIWQTGSLHVYERHFHLVQ